MKTIQDLMNWDTVEQDNILVELRAKQITPEQFSQKLQNHRVKFAEELNKIMVKKAE